MRRGDGRLSAVADPSDVGQDECGVFGVWAPAEEVAQLAYFGLYALQHRGTESAGIATSDGRSVIVYKDMGLVSQVFDDQLLRSLRGHMAVAHVRYATTGRSTWENAQPTLGPTATGTVALAHNGNLVNTVELMEQVRSRFGEDLRGELGRGSSTDTAVITALLGGEDRVEHTEHPQLPARHALLPAVRAVLPKLRGAFSLVFMDEHTLYAARDAHGVRPLVLGRLARGWVVASETAALDIIGAAFVREVEPGEILAIDADGVHTERFAPANPKGCVFEYVYLARPDTLLAGQSIQVAREKMGELLARDHHVEADLVISTPDSGTPAAIGYARASGIPYGMGLVKNAYVGRTFIQPTQMMRQRGIRLKLNPLRHVIEGKRLVVVDDSIVRGNTQRALVRMLREAGAREVHVRISSPPVTWPCFYGIDFATRAELISAGANVEEVCQSIGADSLGYLSLPAMVEASGQPAQALCLACFDGNYPIPLEPQQLAAAAHPPLAAAPVVLPPRRSVRHGAGAPLPTIQPHEEKPHE
ncbi:amidophosphoribosyltransferase [Buchananella hordeovulneris]|uniref:amidophosphoribosyltransferase n=1 Tax=Buchananella hordeovulneris TaxID=52770 RepID=UPI000F5F2C05|nr:amidophosphoribosyltransferase [Buchananella hordeovulneris]MDO5080636.1 amidophosphoribosyltransferase [Buchananella hordeovulneris]RRD42581.1 amidophosphoribosyltransferase [Buchananella hordeovulneris]RRD52918.1 amidophosphoribosyltransferase [Buchananella hordeovulneris]